MAGDDKVSSHGTMNQFQLDGSEDSTDGVLRIGTSASRYSLGTTPGREGARLNFTSPALSGTARGLDVRLTQTGAAGEADCFRSLQKVSANTTTCRGAHISLEFLATAGASECSGLGTPLETTLHIPDVASWAPTGTLCALKVAINSDGAASDPAGLTELSFIRIDNQGNATGMEDVDTDAAIFSINGFTASADATHAVSSTRLAELPASSIGFQVKVDGAIYYIPAVIAAEWN